MPDAEAAGKTMTNISSEVRRWRERRAAATVSQSPLFIAAASGRVGFIYVCGGTD